MFSANRFHYYHEGKIICTGNLDLKYKDTPFHLFIFVFFYYCQMELTMLKIIIALYVNDYFNMVSSMRL